MRTRACYPRSCRCRCSPVDKNTVCDFVRPRFEPGSGRRQKLREREGERIWRQGAIRQGESPPMSATCEFHGSIEWNSPRQRRGMESDPGGGFRFTFLVSWFSGLVFANQQRGWEFLASLVRRFVVLAAKLEILTCEFWLHSSRAYPGCLADSGWIHIGRIWLRACLYFVKWREVFEKPGGGRIERIGHRFSVQLSFFREFREFVSYIYRSISTRPSPFSAKSRSKNLCVPPPPRAPRLWGHLGN